MEEVLKETGIPTADFECDVASYVDILCGLLDIPIHKSRIQSLHVFFSLYSAFKHSQHFNQLAQENNYAEEADTMVGFNEFWSHHQETQIWFFFFSFVFKMIFFSLSEISIFSTFALIDGVTLQIFYFLNRIQMRLKFRVFLCRWWSNNEDT